MRSLWQDLRYTFRQLRQAPVYALTAVLTLALGLGAVTAMLAIVDSVLIRPVALPHAERLVNLGRMVKGKHETYLRPSDLQALRRNARSFQAFAAYSSLPAPVATADGTRVAGEFTVLPGFFEVPAVRARLGRVPSLLDGSAPLAVVNDQFWQDNLHGDPHAVGRRVTVQGRPLTVAGVLPPGFAFPGVLNGPVIYTPLVLNAEGKDVHGFSSITVIARVKAGVSPASALAEARAIYAHQAPAKDEDRGELTFQSYRDSVTGDEQPALLALLGACALLLLIACINAANLQIARAAARTGEISMRAALGATRARLLRQLVTESVAVSALGAGFGLLLASAILYGVRAGYGEEFPRFNELALSPRIFAACALLALLTGAAAAVAPAWSAARSASSSRFSQAARVTRRSRAAGGLIAIEIALTGVLLVTAGLFLRTFRALEQAPLGFDPSRVTEMVLMPTNPKESGSALKLGHERLLARLAGLPGVEAAATQTSLPFSNMNLSLGTSFRVQGRPQHKGEESDLAFISAGYAAALGIRPREGRSFLESDNAGSQPVCIVNEAFRRRYLAGARAVGSVIEFTRDSTDEPDDRQIKAPLTVVGVVPDAISGRELAETPGPRIFVPFAQFPPDASMAHFMFGIAPQFAVRSALPQAALERELRGALKEAAPDMAEMQIAPLEGSIESSLTRQRLALRLAGGFGLLALVLAAVGIYGVLASSVAQRTREIGIRMALGAGRARTVALVAREAAAMVLLGLGLGLGCSWPAGRAVKAFLFGVAPLDPLSLALAAGALLVVAALAALVPAGRAASVDPVIALRSE